jgi:hypothetical protein
VPPNAEKKENFQSKDSRAKLAGLYETCLSHKHAVQTQTLKGG